MFKIWARVIKEDKIINQYMLKEESAFMVGRFHTYLMQICKELDLETPIILNKHKNNFKDFNSTKFTKSDFLQPIDFDYLILENVPL